MAETEELSPIKRALLEIRELRARLDESERRAHEPIAIIGMGLRFPGGAVDAASFWKLLAEGVDAIREVPADRWDIEAFYDPDPDVAGKMAVRHGGFIEGAADFDAAFFGISPREAESLDPQQRLLLEVTWEALENAGIAPDALFGSQTGVFLGISNTDYYRMLLADPQQIDTYTTTGNAPSVAGGRLSYTLGLHGPNVSVDTACSASLAAVHLAMQSLRKGECSLALAGGVNLILTPELTINFSRAHMMAADGRCKTFDAAADGYVRGEGAGMIALKRLSDAQRDGDIILALLRGSAINHDGRSGGLTAPNGPAQEAVIRAALADAGLPPDRVGYVEAHGTGTSLGDPIEVHALAAALARPRATDNPLYLGSVKTNFGHLESAAGIAGLIKAVLALQHKEIPAHLNFTTLNPHISLEGAPIVINTALTPWPSQQPRIAGVSSFGLSGTNAHVVIEESAEWGDDRRPMTIDRPSHVLTLSAKNEDALRVLAARHRETLGDGRRTTDDGRLTTDDRRQPTAESTLKIPNYPITQLPIYQSTNLPDYTFSAATARSHFSHRLAIVASEAAEAVEKINAFLTGETAPGVFTGQMRTAKTPQIAFLFTGHGAHYRDMGRQLYDTSPVFRAALAECDAALQPLLGESILPILFSDRRPATDDRTYPPSPPFPTREGGQGGLGLDQISFTQPALFAVQYALAMLWRSWGVEPTLMAGHSGGEYAAACAAGVFSLEDALKLVTARGRLMGDSQPGMMAAVFASEAVVREALGGMLTGDGSQRSAVSGQQSANDDHPSSFILHPSLSIAVINNPENTVLSGEPQAVEAALEVLKQHKIKARKLPIAQGAHSPLVDPILDAFEAVAAAIQYSEPQVGLVSTVTGRLAQPGEMTQPGYWRRHLRQTVRFADAMRTLSSLGCDTFIEIGPNPVLITNGQRCLTEAENAASQWLPSLREGQSDWAIMLESLAMLYTRGATIDWRGFDGPYPRRRLQLPTYPFQRQRYWTSITLKPTAPAPRPIWETAVAAAAAQARQGPLDLGLHSYPAKWQVLKQLTVGYISVAFRGLGVFTRANEQYRMDDLLTRAAIQPVYTRLMARWLNKLVEAGLLKSDGETFTAPTPLPAPALETLWESAAALLADIPVVAEYVRRCGERLPAVLTGSESPLDTLFPSGSFTQAETLYQHWAVSRYYQWILRAAVEAIVNTRLAGEPLRILEIGAGTGATTAWVLPVLPAARTSYVFTDVSDIFLNRAAEKFREYPFLSYGLLDIEKRPSEQGYAPGSFDIVIATNVLHATPNLNDTLQNAAELLVPGGLLLVNEATTILDWHDITTGLIGGWQRFDDEWRSDHPLLPATTWLQALTSNGYTNAATYPETGADTEILGQHVLMAQTPAGGLAAAREGAAPAGFSQPASAAAGATPAGGAPAPEDAPVPAAFLDNLRAAQPFEREEMLVALARQQVARVLRLKGPAAVDPYQRLLDMGLDSLMALELRKLLAEALAKPEKELSATLVFDYPTVAAIAKYLLDEVLGEEKATADRQPPTNDGRPPAADRKAEVAEMSDDEVAALLLQKLGQPKSS